MHKADRLALGLKLKHFVKPGLFDESPARELPKAYRKFYDEWKCQEKEPVHYVPEEGKWKRNPVTGEVTPVQNIPIPLKFPKEFHECLLGGEEMIVGFKQNKKYVRRVPKIYIPVLKSSVVYSEILNKNMQVTITNRVIHQIHKNYGFDNYILSTRACDLQSELGVKLKRTLLLALHNKDIGYDDIQKQEEIFNKYKHYLDNYTEEELEWYGLPLRDAIKKRLAELEKANKPEPLKHAYRTEFIKMYLEKEATSKTEDSSLDQQKSTSWLSKINPFGSKGKQSTT